MTDETKKAFTAPWHSDLKEDYVIDAKGFVIAKCLSNPITNCISHLPELYDALEQAAHEFCEGCLVKHGYLDEEHSYYDLISSGCVLNAKGCKAFPWLKLLQKVRDGE